LELNRINAVHLFKHKPCRTPVALCRASTSCLIEKIVDDRDKPGHDENKQGATTMPEITISMAAGRTDEQKAGMMRDITHALVTNLGVDADAVGSQINEAPLAH